MYYRIHGHTYLNNNWTNFKVFHQVFVGINKTMFFSSFRNSCPKFFISAVFPTSAGFLFYPNKMCSFKTNESKSLNSLYFESLKISKTLLHFDLWSNFLLPAVLILFNKKNIVITLKIRLVNSYALNLYAQITSFRGRSPATWMPFNFKIKLKTIRIVYGLILFGR